MNETKKSRRSSEEVRAEKIKILEESIKFHKERIILLETKVEALKNNKTKSQQKAELLTSLLEQNAITKDQATLLGLK